MDEHKERAVVMNPVETAILLAGCRPFGRNLRIEFPMRVFSGIVEQTGYNAGIITNTFAN